jgi:mono/diheme cytochrome c family protein
MAPKRDTDHAYDINRLNMFFAITSIVMFLFFAWILWQDYDRQWKGYQAKFLQLERARTKASEAEELDKLKSDAEYQKVLADLKAAEDELDRQNKEYEKAKDQQTAIQGVWYRADQAFRFKKAEFESRRYDYEEAVADHPKDAPKLKSGLDQSEEQMKTLSADLDQVNAKKAEIDNRVNDFTHKIDDLEKKRTGFRSKRDRLVKKYGTIDTSFANVFRNLPIVDFIQPSIKIRQVVVDNQFEDLNFTRVPRVDRCMTCHTAIGEKGYEKGTDIPNYGAIGEPFASHPNLNLYVNSNSKHPIETFGCTGCHLGRGRSTDFIGSVHMPEDEKEQERWEKKLDWERLHYWDYPMYKISMVEASCVKCHQGVARIPEGNKINVSRSLFIEYGCHGCHLTKGFEGLPKIGPDLRHVSSKVTKDWAFKWVQNPKAFRPTTRMPRYFGISNNSKPEDIDRTNVEIRAMVEFIFSKSTPLDYQPVSLSGDPANGKKLVADLGCVGCHLREGEQPASIDTRRRFGPPLIGLGSKTNATWLYNWLKEPRHYSPVTRMPNMRLSDQEAMDIASYLLSLHETEWENQKLPELKQEYLKDEIVFYLKRTVGLQAEQEYNKMSEEQRWSFLGEKAVARYGCTGCHLIQGYETAKGIGTSLSEEGSKKVTKFDFGFVNIDHSVPAYISQKLHEPRSFDQDRVKRWDERLVMPNFEFNSDEVQAVTMLIMGLTNEKVPAEAQRVLTAREQVAERGKWLVVEKNCVACHKIDGWGGEISTVITEQGMAPPLLNNEGEKVQSDWLFPFLKNPGHIRPWLHVRMPNFRLSDEETNTLVQYFMAYANVGPFQTTPDSAVHLSDGENLFHSFQCASCHVVGGVVPQGKTSADLAPDLTMASTRLRPEWILKWLNDPQALMPGTRMPDFFPEAALPGVLNGDPSEQIKALRNYIFSIGRGPQASISAPTEAPPVEKPPETKTGGTK